MNRTDEQQPSLLMLFGPPAVGKMTVGQELERITPFRLLYNHQFIDLLTDYFPFATPAFDRLDRAYRRLFFEEAAQEGLNLITTCSWDFAVPAHQDIVWSWVEPCVVNRGRVYFVELIAPLHVRLDRNQSANRRRHKKLDWATSDYLSYFDSAHRLDSGGSIPFDLPFLRLDTENLSVEDTARLIRDHFGLQNLVTP
jgi:hypothetical protein